MNINFKYKEGDRVFISVDENTQEFMITGLHYLNGGRSYTISNAGGEIVKYEYELEKYTKAKHKKRTIDVGFQQIGELHKIDIDEN